MALYEDFCGKQTLTISEASKFAKAWRDAKAQTRKAACARLGAEFKLPVEGTRTTFVFSVAGVKTINTPKYSRPKTLDEVMDYSRPVAGFSKGRPIYA